MKLIHLSDIHVGQPDKPFQESIHQPLLDDVKRMTRDVCQQSGKVFSADYIIVTGDLAFSGSEAQYKEAFSFINRVAEAANVDLDRILIIPGNHDVNFDLTDKVLHAGLLGMPEEFDNREEELLIKLEAFYVATRQSKYHRSTHNAYWTFEDTKNNAVFVGMNTALFSYRRSEVEAGSLRIGKKQLSMLSNIPEDKFLVVMAHHPIHELILEEADQLKSILSRRNHILLTGHKHIGIGTSEREIGRGTILNMQSGAVQRGTQEQARSEYSWIDIEEQHQEVVYYPRLYVGEQRQFLANQSICGRSEYVREPLRISSHNGVVESNPVDNTGCLFSRAFFSQLKDSHEEYIDSSSTYILLLRTEQLRATWQYFLKMSEDVFDSRIRLQGAYDLYGPYDCLVKITANTDRDVVQHVMTPLIESGSWSRIDTYDKCLEVNVRWESHVPRNRQDSTSANQLKAFLLFREVTNSRDLGKLCSRATDPESYGGAQLAVRLNGVYYGNENFIAEYDIACGGFYDFSRVVSYIENAMEHSNQLGKYKVTLMAKSIFEPELPSYENLEHS